MHPEYNRYNLEPRFKEYLLAENIHVGTVKQYLSDFRHFFGWISFEVSKLRGIQATENIDLDTYITSELIEAYKSYLSTGDTPHKTGNRRLSTVRKFCTFLQVQGILSSNPAAGLSNIHESRSPVAEPRESSIETYKRYLAGSKDNKNNQYLVDDIQELFTVIRSNT